MIKHQSSTTTTAKIQLKMAEANIKANLTLGGTPYELELLLPSQFQDKRKILLLLAPWEGIVLWAATQSARPFQPFSFETREDTHKQYTTGQHILRFIQQNMGSTLSGAALRRLLLLFLDVGSGGDNDNDHIARAALEVEAQTGTRQKLLSRHSGDKTQKNPSNTATANKKSKKTSTTTTTRGDSIAAGSSSTINGHPQVDKDFKWWSVFERSRSTAAAHNSSNDEVVESEMRMAATEMEHDVLLFGSQL